MENEISYSHTSQTLLFIQFGLGCLVFIVLFGAMFTGQTTVMIWAGALELAVGFMLALTRSYHDGLLGWRGALLYAAPPLGFACFYSLSLLAYGEVAFVLIWLAIGLAAFAVGVSGCAVGLWGRRSRERAAASPRPRYARAQP